MIRAVAMTTLYTRLRKFPIFVRAARAIGLYCERHAANSGLTTQRPAFMADFENLTMDEFVARLTRRDANTCWP